MQRGRKPDPQNELAELTQGLTMAEDPYGLAELREHSLEDLLNAVRQEIRYAVVAMARSGRIFHAMKEKVGHGDWLDFLDKHHIPRSYARGCMKVVDVLVIYPKAAHLPAGDVTHRLLNSSMAKIDVVLSALPVAAIKQLTPWQLEEIYRVEEEKQKKPGSKKDIVLPPVDVTELALLVTECLRALKKIEVYEIPKELYAKAKADCARLSAAWDRASYNLYDPAHETVPPWESDARFDPVGEDDEDEARA